MHVKLEFLAVFTLCYTNRVGVHNRLGPYRRVSLQCVDPNL